jgi:hypothetical protein
MALVRFSRPAISHRMERALSATRFQSAMLFAGGTPPRSGPNARRCV